MTTSRVIRKSLAGREDLLLGRGTVTQTRNGQDYPIAKVNLIWPVYSAEELNDLDTELVKHALLDGRVYNWSGSEWESAGDALTVGGKTAEELTTVTANALADSGRFDGSGGAGLVPSAAFDHDNQLFKLVVNGAVFSDGGKFIDDNSVYGGINGALHADVISLLEAMGRDDKRYGAEFFLAKIVAGAGTESGFAGADGTVRYLMTANKLMLNTVNTRLCCWINVLSGSVHSEQIDYIDGSTAPVGATIPAGGWRKVSFSVRPETGAETTFPQLRATQGAEIKIALPYLHTDELPVPELSAPIPTIGGEGVVGTVLVTTDIGTSVQAHSADTPSTVVPQLEAETGTATISRTWTAQRVKQAIDALGDSSATVLFSGIGPSSDKITDATVVLAEDLTNFTLLQVSMLVSGQDKGLRVHTLSVAELTTSYASVNDGHASYSNHQIKYKKGSSTQLKYQESNTANGTSVYSVRSVVGIK